MIVLEGPDNSGKSTLGKRLSKSFGLVLKHSERPTKGMLPQEVLSHSRSQLIPARVIQDRVYAISEYVYGYVIRGKTDLGIYHSEALKDLYSRNHLIIYCRPPLKTILNNRGRDQMDGVLDNHRTLVLEYDEVMEDVARYSNCQVVRYDYENQPYEFIKEKVAAHLSELESQQSSIQFLTEFKHAKPQEG